MKAALLIDGQIDSVRRLHRDPPVEYNRTAWGTHEKGGETVLIETAVVECPECGGRAYWAGGNVGCIECDERYRMIG